MTRSLTRFSNCLVCKGLLDNLTSIHGMPNKRPIGVSKMED